MALISGRLWYFLSDPSRCWRKKSPYFLWSRVFKWQCPAVLVLHWLSFSGHHCKRLCNPCPVASGNHFRLSLQNPLALSCLPFESCHFYLRLDTVDFLSFLTDTDRSGVFVANNRNPIETDLNKYIIEKSACSRIQGLQQYYHVSVSISCLCRPFCWLHSGRLVPSGDKLATSKGGLYHVTDCLNVPNSSPLLHALCQ